MPLYGRHDQVDIAEAESHQKVNTERAKNGLQTRMLVSKDPPENDHNDEKIECEGKQRDE